MNELQRRIQEAAQRYYTDGSSNITDEEFDDMVSELQSSDPNSKLLRTGWGYNVEKDSTPGNKIHHLYGEVGSLNKFRTWAELSRLLKDTDVIASLKLDGISIVLYYDRGELIHAVTRGDGYVGIDILNKVKIIDSDLLILEDKSFSGAVRGEIIMSNANFAEFSNLHSEAKNPRNTTAGLINSSELSDDLKYLDIVVYRIIGSSKDNYSSYSQILSKLNRLFKNVVQNATIQINESSMISIMNNLKDSWYIKYPADGIVIAHDNIDKDVCTNGYTYSYESQAFKFPAETKITEVEDVEWALSKSKYLIPRIKIKPVQLSGTQVSYATGFNAKYIKDNQIGCHAIVSICKSGEIIPDIQNVLSPGQIDMPKHCPACNVDLEWRGVHLYCPNKHCKDQTIQDLLIWSNTLAPKEGLGDTLRLKFYKGCYGDEVSIDKIMLDKAPTSIDSRFSGTQFNAFLDTLNILHTSRFNIIKALQALNVPRLGAVTCEKLSQHRDIIIKILDVACENRPKWELLNLHTILGEANSQAIIDNIHKFQKLAYIFDRIDWSDDNKIHSNVQVAITGKLSVKRDIFIEELRANGYTVSELSKNTDVLITDDPNSNSSKNIKATKYGIPKMSENEFRDKYLKHN